MKARRSRTRSTERRGSQAAWAAAAAGGGLVAVASVLSGSVAEAAPADHIVVSSESGAAAGAQAGSKLYAAGKETLADAIAYLNGEHVSGGTITFASNVTGIDLTTATPPYVGEPTTINGGGRVKIEGYVYDTKDYTFARYPVLGVYSGVSGTTTFEGLTIEGAGSRAILASSPLKISDSTLTGNECTPSGRLYPGAAVYADETDVTITDSTFTDNNCQAGSAIYAKGGDLTITGSTFSNNYASQDRGTIVTYQGSATIKDSTIADNTSYSDGAGLYDNGSSLTVTGSTIVGNRLNSSSYHPDGAGIYIAADAGPVTLDDTVVAGNQAATDPDVQNLSDVEVSASHSLIGDTDGSDIAQDAGNDDILGLSGSLELGALGWNGGPTETMLPRAGSPLLGKGAAFGLKTDQRGGARSSGGKTDIGSVEVLPKETVRATAGNRRLALTLPPAGVCPSPGLPLRVSFASTARQGSPKLRFERVSFRTGGSRHTSYRSRVSLGLSVAGLAAGHHTLRAVVVYRASDHRTVTRTLRGGFTVCTS